MFEETVTWSEAKSACEGKGVMLAKLSLETLASLPTLTAGSYWVGASDSEVEGQWRWDDASSVTADV